MKNIKSKSLFSFNILISLIIFLTLLIFNTSYADSGQLKVTFLDIGQGDCEIIRTPSGKVIMIDAGDDRANAAEGAILPYLAANNIKKIDIVIMSHAHRDHIGGLIGLIPKIEIGAVYENRPSNTQMYEGILKMLKEKNIPVHQVWKDDKIDFGDGIDVTVLHPPKKWATSSANIFTKITPETFGQVKITNVSKFGEGVYNSEFRNANNQVVGGAGEENLNNHSIVIRMQYKDMVYQFGGDAEEPAETEMLKTVPESIIKTYVYKVCHHGSATSSMPAYMAKMRPEVSVISCGVNNQFKHPRPGTLKNLEYYSKVIYRTDIDKTIESWSDGKTIDFSTGNSPNAIIAPPVVTNITPYSATIEWETSQPSSTIVKYYDAENSGAVNEKSCGEYVLNHKITLAGLASDKIYNFEVKSVNPKEPSKLVDEKGSFKTVPAAFTSIPDVTFSTVPGRIFVMEPVKVMLKISGMPDNSNVTLYENSIAVSNIIDAPAALNKSNSAFFNWTPKQSKNYEMFAVVKSGENVCAIKRFTLNSMRLTVMIDEAHENVGVDNFEDLKVDLYKNGLNPVSNRSKLTDESLKKAAVLIISEYSTGEAGLSNNEIKAVKNFVDGGGGLLLIGRCDYKGMANPQTLNKILEQTGSNMRINNDEVTDPTNCLGGMPWVMLAHLFEPSIISGDVKTILLSGSASVLNANMQPVTALDKTIIPLCYGDNDCSNIDSDGTGNAVIYPAGGKIIIDAAEIMPSGGKIAVFGSQHYSGNLYNFTSQHQIPVYNYKVINWLAHKAVRGIKELAAEITAVADNKNNINDNNSNKESAVLGASIRAASAFEKLEKEFNSAALKVEDSIDKLILYVKTDNNGNIAEKSALIKKALDRARYEAAQNPDLLKVIQSKIDFLQETYEKLNNSEK